MVFAVKLISSIREKQIPNLASTKMRQTMQNVKKDSYLEIYGHDVSLCHMRFNTAICLSNISQGKSVFLHICHSLLIFN